MRILILSTWWPEPDDNGSRLRAMAILRGLAARHELHLLAFSQGPATKVQTTEISRLCRSWQAFERPDRPLTLSDRLGSITSSKPASVRVRWSTAFAEAVVAAAKRWQPDVVLAMQIDVAAYACLVPNTPLVLEELELASILESYRHQSGLDRLRSLLTATQHRRYVSTILPAFAAVTTVSEREAELARQIVGSQRPVITVIPNGVDSAACAAYGYRPEPDTLIYPGALSYSANFDAVDYFLRSIWPLIRARHPQARFRITGRVTDEQRAALPNMPGVEYTGYVDNIRDVIARHAVEVTPIREGGGTRLKILEALALGVPVVSTSKGAEGLELIDGKHLLLADTPMDFARATSRLLTDPPLARRLGETGRQAVAVRYDWRVIVPRLNDMLEEVAQPRKLRYDMARA
ncbi:glycosyltransferase family 4 protein [uncultured Chloroflexus sp.]|uniref:glycosyltransferase family 4 protein n=1 Tax=uncultured Chloroflexus sp. TaxID=214040 RepID=UPI002621D79C|nr:glycosyltransferase family 4 protein [uncultured Chloroflexus sp.]